MKLTAAQPKHKALVCLALLLIFTLFLWSSFKSGPIVHGELSRQDVSAIVRAVNKDMWREAFPDFSWSTIKQAPRALLWAVSGRVSEVTQTFENGARANGSFRLEFRNFDTTSQSLNHQRMTGCCDCWTLKKEETTWTIQFRGRKQDVASPRPLKSIEETGSFSQSLSNSARLSLDSKPNF